MDARYSVVQKERSTRRPNTQATTLMAETLPKKESMTKRSSLSKKERMTTRSSLKTLDTTMTMMQTSLKERWNKQNRGRHMRRRQNKERMRRPTTCASEKHRRSKVSNRLWTPHTARRRISHRRNCSRPAPRPSNDVVLHSLSHRTLKSPFSTTY